MTEIITAPVQNKRKRIVVAGLAAVVLCAGIAGASVSSTGAWFTAKQTATSNTVTAGTLSLGNLGEGTSLNVSATNIYPMTDAQAVVAANYPDAVINLRNTGTLPLDYSVLLSNLVVKDKAGAVVTTAGQYIKASVWNGTAWATPKLLTAVIADSASTAAAVSTNVWNPGTDLAAGASTSIKVRVFFDGATTPDTLQGASINFQADATAMQTNKQ